MGEESGEWEVGKEPGKHQCFLGGQAGEGVGGGVGAGGVKAGSGIHSQKSSIS